MKNSLYIIVASLFMVSSVTAQELVNVSGASDIALGGYDPVAFFTDGKAVHGNPSISATNDGATYIFASEEHKTLFESEADKYVPQHGGFCSYGVSVGALFPVDIDTWQIVDGKLYLNLNPDILKTFNMDQENNIEKANENWPKLVAKHQE